MAVAEKLNRNWITCDIGKLSYFTQQKRILKIDQSYSLTEGKKLTNNYAKCEKCGNKRVLCSNEYKDVVKKV